MNLPAEQSNKTQRKIATRIRRRRQELLLDHKGMAQRLKLSPEYYQRIEAGSDPIPNRMLTAICMELRIAPSEIAANDDALTDKHY